MFSIAICDDEPAILKVVHQITAQYFHTQHVGCTIETYNRSDTLRDDLEDGKFFDLFLLDIEMPNVDGMTLAEKIHATLPAATMIFITSHLEYAISAYEFSIFRYIPKSSITNKLPQALADFYKLYALERGDFYTIAVKNHVEKIAHRDILYVLKDGKYAVFYLRSGRTTQVRKSLSVVADELGPSFLMADRGCIVNLANVDSMDGQDILLDGHRVPISKGSVTDFKMALLHFWEGQL